MFIIAGTVAPIRADITRLVHRREPAVDQSEKDMSAKSRLALSSGQT